MNGAEVIGRLRRRDGMNVKVRASAPEAPRARGGGVANISYVTRGIWTGGDLPSELGEKAMLADLVEIQKAGITHILDNRIEWSDEEFIRSHAPKLGFLWNGADDRGQVMQDQWFDAGVNFASEAMVDPDAQVLVHCHMGINRGPSMAFAILLTLGMTPVRALTAIRRARPIAAIAYAEDALDWWHRREQTCASSVARQRAEVARWSARNQWNPDAILHTMRNNEADGDPSPR
jgi:dual specificity phosphatase 3